MAYYDNWIFFLFLNEIKLYGIEKYFTGSFVVIEAARSTTTIIRCGAVVLLQCTVRTRYAWVIQRVNKKHDFREAVIGPSEIHLCMCAPKVVLEGVGEKNNWSERSRRAQLCTAHERAQERDPQSAASSNTTHPLYLPFAFVHMGIRWLVMAISTSLSVLGTIRSQQ